MEHPFTCGDPAQPDAAEGVPCPAVRPVDDLLSCDASGCHGDFDFSEATSQNRDLIGSDGPSCYACHGDEWNDG
jgi:hypothetical protein